MGKHLFTYRFRVYSALAALALLTSCLPRGADLAGMLKGVDNKPILLADRVNFATLKAKVLEPQCMSCHADFATEEGIKNYVVAGDPDHSVLFTDIKEGSMPPSGPALSGALQDVVKHYINDLVSAPPTPEPSPSPSASFSGSPSVVPSPDPSTDPSPAPSPARVDFAALKDGFLAPSCLECHAPFRSEAMIDQLIKAGDPANSILYQRSTDGTMPPRGPAPSPEDLALLRKYIDEVTPVAAP